MRGPVTAQAHREPCVAQPFATLQGSSAAGRPPRPVSPGHGGQPLTFLHGLERIVGLDDLDGVGDLLALQDVIVEAQVGYGQLEHPVVLGRVLLEDGTWRRGGVKAIGLEGAASPPHPYPSLGPLVMVLAGLQVARWQDFWAAVSA